MTKIAASPAQAFVLVDTLRSKGHDPPCTWRSCAGWSAGPHPSHPPAGPLCGLLAGLSAGSSGGPGCSDEWAGEASAGGGAPFAGAVCLSPPGAHRCVPRDARRSASVPRVGRGHKARGQAGSRSRVPGARAGASSPTPGRFQLGTRGPNPGCSAEAPPGRASASAAYPKLSGCEAAARCAFVYAIASGVLTASSPLKSAARSPA
jgi:hypothetical protein